MSRYDFVIFGASGFTGEYVVEEVARTCPGKSWAVAGRSRAKLETTLKNAGDNVGKDLSKIPIIIADVSDEESLAHMATQAKIVINVVGPYRFYGEPVVKACVENGACHVDVSGEPIYLESMQLNYDEKAKATKVFVVGSCGFDSIPCDMGLEFAKKNMPGDMSGAETVVDFKSGPKGMKINFGTFQSMIYGIANRNELKPIRKQLALPALPKSQYRLPKRSSLFHCDRVDGYCLPFMGSDKSVAHRSQVYNFESRNERPVQVNTYFKSGGLLESVAMIMWGIMFFLLASFEFGRKLLEKYPEALTFGKFSKAGPSREQVEEAKFSYWIFAKGWSDKIPDPAVQHSTPPDTELVARVDGPDPGYVGTAICLVACARTILDEHAKLPQGGGVFSPAALFQETQLIERLDDRGVKFSLVTPATRIVQPAQE